MMPIACKQVSAVYINPDKIQVYKGLDITTNNVSAEDCCDFRSTTAATVIDVVVRSVVALAAVARDIVVDHFQPSIGRAVRTGTLLGGQPETHGAVDMTGQKKMAGRALLLSGKAKIQHLIWVAICFASSLLPLVEAATENNTMAQQRSTNTVARELPNSSSITAAIVFGMLIPLLFLLFCIFMQNRTAMQNPPDIMETFPRYVFPCEGYVTFGDTCPICIDKFQDGETVLSTPYCAHIFHSRCIRRWVVEQGQRTCPTCRSTF